MATMATVAGTNAIAAKLNVALAIAYLTLNFYQFFILPAWLLPIALLNNAYWSLLHEAIHDLFHPIARINVLSAVCFP